MFFLGLWAAKIYYKFFEKQKMADRMGVLACRFDDKFLYKIAKPKTIIAVTGTNGKSTTCAMIADMLEAKGYKVAINRDGANLRAGLVKALILNTTIFNKTKADYAVLEFCEFHTGYLLDPIQPDYVVVTNLFSDTISDVGHVDYAFYCINTGIPKNSTVLLNADDLISCELAKDNKRLFFSIKQNKTDAVFKPSLIKDIKVCPKCFSPLVYDFTRYHHLGRAHCENCGFTNPKADYLCSDIDNEKKEMIVNGKAYHCLSDATFNAYNQLASITLADLLHIDDVNASFKGMKITSTRYNEVKVNGKTIITHLAKGENPIAISRAIDYCVNTEGKKDIIMVIEDNGLRKSNHLEEIMSYLYMCDFEILKSDKVNRIIIGGDKPDEFKLRLLLAGVDEKKIYCAPEFESYKCVDEKIDKVYILYSVANILHVGKIVEKLEECWK